MLFQMVEGCDLDSSLLELVECISWDALAAAPACDRRWFCLSETSSQRATASLHQMTSSPALPLPQQLASLTPSAAPPLLPQTLITPTQPLSPPQSLLTPEGTQSAMDLGPDSATLDQSSSQPFLPTTMDLGPDSGNLDQSSSQPFLPTTMDLGPDSGNLDQSSSQPFLPTTLTPLPPVEGEEPMDTRPDGEKNLTVNGRPAPDLDYDESRLNFGTSLPEQSSSELFLPTASTPLPQVEGGEPMETWPDSEENLTVNGCLTREPDSDEWVIFPYQKSQLNFGTDLSWNLGDAGEQGEAQHREEGKIAGSQDPDEDEVEDRSDDELTEDDEQEQQ